MIRSLGPFLLILCLAVTACGKAGDHTNMPTNAAPSAVHKCPDPNIRDQNNPCSPYYYKPPVNSFKGQKSF